MEPKIQATAAAEQAGGPPLGVVAVRRWNRLCSFEYRFRPGHSLSDRIGIAVFCVVSCN
jgi:hypothetical protein